MASRPIFMLFCPPIPPLRLDPDTPVSIGRHPDCHLSLQRDDVSRIHAEVRFHEGRWMIRDLGSTNGTWVGGEPVEGDRPLQSGERIDLGSTGITFCEIESAVVGAEAAASPSEEKTIVFAREEMPRVSDALRGDLSQVPGHAVMQLLEMGGQTGRLEVETHAGPGRIWFRQGRPIHAETDKATGLDAALSLVSADRGRFRFEVEAEVGVESTIQASVTELLLESCRLADEGTR